MENLLSVEEGAKRGQEGHFQAAVRMQERT